MWSFFIATVRIVGFIKQVVACGMLKQAVACIPTTACVAAPYTLPAGGMNFKNQRVATVFFTPSGKNTKTQIKPFGYRFR